MSLSVEKIKILKIKKHGSGFLVHYEYKGKPRQIRTAFYENPMLLINFIAGCIRYSELTRKPIPQKVKELEGKEVEI